MADKTKIGDKVRITDSKSKYYGQIGLVIRMKPRLTNIQFANNQTSWFLPYKYEIVSVKKYYLNLVKNGYK